MRKNPLSRFATAVVKYKHLYLLSIPGLRMLILFRYISMCGIAMAFEKYRVGLGIFRSKWIGFGNFVTFFENPYSLVLIRNTFLLGFCSLLFGFPVPILLALAFNEVRRCNQLSLTITLKGLTGRAAVTAQY